MDKDEVIKVISAVLAEVQSSSGRQPVVVTGDTCPIGDLDGFDSLNGVEASVELSDRLGVDLPGVNAFINEKGTEALKVSEIADNICQVSGSTEAK